MTNNRRRPGRGAVALFSHPGAPALLLAMLGVSLPVIIGACTSSDPIFRTGAGGTGGSNLGGDTGSLGGRQAGEGGRQAGEGGRQAGEGGRQAGEGGNFGAAGGQPGIGGTMLGIGGDTFNTGGQAGFNTGGQPGYGGASGDCDKVVTLSDCEARLDCYSVFFDPGSCGCLASGCCAHFHHCANGYTAECAGQVSCAVSSPHCESPYLVSFHSGCYEGCVHNKDCAP